MSKLTLAILLGMMVIIAHVAAQEDDNSVDSQSDGKIFVKF